MSNKIVKAEDLIQESGIEGELIDFITNRSISNKPENREAKVPFEKRLVEEYGFSKTDVEPEFRIQHGHHTIGPADIVVFHPGKPHIQENIYIIVECKKKDSKDGEAQLKSYLAPCKTAKFGVWFNGSEAKYFKKLDKDPHWREILNIPTAFEKEGLPRKADLKPIVDLSKLLEPIHHKIYADGGLSSEEIFDEIIKLMFTKIADEKDSSSPFVSFGISDEEEDDVANKTSNDFRARIEDLFEKVKRRYKDLFDESDKIRIQTSTLAYIAAQFENLSFRNTDRDIKAAAFQKFVYAHQRGERGQFFTPDPIIKLAVEIISPKEDESVIDPACGTGGFLVHTMKYVWNNIDNSNDDAIDKDRRKRDYARDKIRGMDIARRLAKVTKMRMILEDDGHTGVFSADSLAPFATIQDEAIKSNATAIQPGSFDIVLTNPPFGSKGKVSSKVILEQFDLARKWKKNETGTFEKTNIISDTVPDILFIERCLNLLKNGGRMGVVLPDGDLTNSTLSYLREYIKNKAKILAVVSLPKETFIPHGAGVKASVLFLQKLSAEELEKEKKSNYLIFFGIVEKIGYEGDKKGTPLYKRDENGELLLDANGNQILDEDVTEVVEEFKKFREINKLEI